MCFDPLSGVGEEFKKGEGGGVGGQEKKPRARMTIMLFANVTHLECCQHESWSIQARQRSRRWHA